MIKLDVDTKQFNKTLYEFARSTRTGVVDVLNTAGMHLCYRAVQTTRHANRGAIEALKTHMATEISKPTKTGKTRFLASYKRKIETTRSSDWRIYEASSVALLIYFWHLYKTGRKPRQFSNRQELMDRALRMVNARISSVDYLRAGWLAAARMFEGVARGTGGVDRAALPRKKQSWGGATIATGNRHEVTVWNSALKGKHDKEASPDLIRYATEGLQQALAVSEQKIRELLEKNLAANAAKANQGA
jgi:hypothetical protein